MALLARSLTPVPSLPELSFTQGDQVVLTLYAQDQFGNPVNITGATFNTQINGPNGAGPATFGNSQHAIVNAAIGQFTLTLAATDTPNCGIGANKDIITQITIGGAPQYYQGLGILTVLVNAPAF